VQMFYAANATPSSTRQMTVSWSSTSGDDTLMFYDVVGAATSPYDTTTSNLGTQSSAGNLTAPPSLTPATSNGLVFAVSVVTFNTVNGLTGSNQIFDAGTYDGMSLDGPQPYDQNNGWMHYYNPNTSAVPFVWTFISGSEAANNWAGMAASFKAPAAGGVRKRVTVTSK
jgi:hypothetical protein